MFFTFPDDARWNAERRAGEFGVEIGEGRGVVRVPRRVIQGLLPERPTPERCVAAYCLQRTRLDHRRAEAVPPVTRTGRWRSAGEVCARCHNLTHPNEKPPASNAAGRH